MSEIPSRKRNSDELDDIRRRNAFQTRPPVQYIQSLELNRLFVGVLYLLVIVSVCLAFAKFYLPGLCCAAVSLLAAILIFWKKPRSSHHAVIITIISLLVLVFGSVYYLEKFEPTAHEDPQGPTRY